MAYIMIKVGCCGLGFFSPKENFGKDWKSSYSSRLQAYSALFDVIEIDSTFYKLPMLKTAERWHSEATRTNKGFEFIAKAPKEITHTYKFDSKAAEYLDDFLKVAKALNSKKILFQTAASFSYNMKNLENVKDFFSTIKGHDIIWEPRGNWLTDGINDLVKYCEGSGVVLCTDPLRSEPEISQRFYYYRLHGFGRGMMYSYRFSDDELRKVASVANRRGAEAKTYIMFNNTYMYEDAARLKSIL
jgi:uncharacterized protein YecE (DUF72 family)